MPLMFTFDLDDRTQSFNVSYNAFVTNNASIKAQIDGYFGLAPCPDNLSEYSLVAKLAKHIGVPVITNLEWAPIPNDGYS